MEKRKRVEALLDQIEMEPSLYIDRLPSELSGGQKQRIGIARALAAEPRFIICDEVTSALDQLVAEGILRLLADLQDNLGLCYMFITHDLATVKSIADEVVVMKDGRVVEAGPKDEMFSPPHHPFCHSPAVRRIQLLPHGRTTGLGDVFYGHRRHVREHHQVVPGGSCAGRRDFTERMEGVLAPARADDNRCFPPFAEELDGRIGLMDVDQTARTKMKPLVRSRPQRAYGAGGGRSGLDRSLRCEWPNLTSRFPVHHIPRQRACRHRIR